MRPAWPMRTGNWCAIDTLLSGAFDTIGEDRDEAKRSGLVAWRLIGVRLTLRAGRNREFSEND
jgi:hypothetical protein